VYYFYVLRSLKNSKLYLGFTPNLKERIKSHNAGENKATKPNIPYELIFYSAFNNEKDAVNCEQYFKTTSGWKRLHKMLENALKELPATVR
jgi:putative endonuclease